MRAGRVLYRFGLARIDHRTDRMDATMSALTFRDGGTWCFLMTDPPHRKWTGPFASEPPDVPRRGNVMALRTQSVRLGKIFKLLLSASLPGEVVAARDAMLAVINSEGCDLHDLAQVLTDGLQPPRATGWKTPGLEDSPRVIATLGARQQISNARG